MLRKTPVVLALVAARGQAPWRASPHTPAAPTPTTSPGASRKAVQREGGTCRNFCASPHLAHLPDRHPDRPTTVHFLRLQFPESLRVALLAGAAATQGCAHENEFHRAARQPATKTRLRHDLMLPTHKREAIVAAPPAVR